MPASIGGISYQPNIRPGEFNPHGFKLKFPSSPIEVKAKASLAENINSVHENERPGLGARSIAVKDGLTLPLKLIDLIRHVTNATASVLQKTSPLIKSIKATKYLSLITLPFGLWDFVSACKDFVKASGFDQRLDAGLSAVGELSGIMDSTVTLAEGLNEAGVVTKGFAEWATPLSALSLALSVSSIILNSRSLWQTVDFKKEFKAHPAFNGSEAHTLDEYIKAIDYLRAKDEAILKKHFKVDGGKFKNQLNRIQQEAQKALQSGSASEVSEAEKKLQKTMKSLKGRVTDKIVNNSISVVSSSVGIVGISILMTQPPLAPVGFSLLAVSSALSITRFIYEEVERRKFEKAIGL